ncbi:MAG: hypothetical protein EA364_13565, partial [Balneolaceae bacterium]
RASPYQNRASPYQNRASPHQNCASLHQARSNLHQARSGLQEFTETLYYHDVIIARPSYNYPSIRINYPRPGNSAQRTEHATSV